MGQKRLLFVVILLLLFTSSSVIGADALYRMLHADEVQSFKKDQDAIIVGKIVGKSRDKFKVEVLKVISGKIKTDSNSILVEEAYYGWGNELPQVEDYTVMSLKKHGNYYKRAWGIFKADSGDFKTLKIYGVNDGKLVFNGDIACIQWFVNSGGIEKDFSFKDSNAYARRPNGEVVQIYPSTEQGSNEAFTESPSENIVKKNDENKTIGTIVVYGFIFTLGIVGIYQFIRSKKKTLG